jgi:hypothetical protein
MKRLLLACALLVLPSLAAFAAESSWVGTWKLDPSKGHIVGDTFDYSKAPNGLIHYSDGSTASFDFGLDGKEYKSWGNHTTTWTATGNNSWKAVTKQDGVVIYETRRELSADGKTLTITTTSNRPDGTPSNDVTVFTRVGGGTGLIGKWRSTKVEIPSPSVFTISSPSPGVLRFESPSYKTTFEGKTDGTDLAVNGPTVPPGYTASVTATSPRTLSYVYKLNGKPDSYNIDTLAADGKSFTSVSWNPGKKSEKTTSVFVKQ